MRILVIDDDGEVREMICRMLLGEGYYLLEAANGKEGLQVVRSGHDIDLVITDLIMPEKEGIETICELKQDFPDIKILAISGGGIGNANQYLHTAQWIGADSTLKKPFLKQDLINAVESLLETR